MRTIVKKYNIEAIWHFTDKLNLDSIVEHNGLLSLSEIENRRTEIPVSGGNEWSHDADKRKGLHNYVHLAFVDDHPMLYVAKNERRINNPIWLKIDPSILYEEGIRFCAEVSNKSGAIILDAMQAKDIIDFDVLFTYMKWQDPTINARRQSAIKSEILVPNYVPINKILGYKNG